MPDRICSVEGCDRGGQLRRGMCGTHYQRWRASGDPGPASIQPRGQSCQVQDCADEHVGLGYCSKHLQRWKRHGDPLKLNYRRPEVIHTGADSPHWKGPDAGYSAAHRRIQATRGSASRHECQHCGKLAAHWAYDHEDPAELARSDGRKYSLNPDHYLSLCISCHWRFDGAAERLHPQVAP
jgi:hypothetical protein